MSLRISAIKFNLPSINKATETSVPKVKQHVSDMLLSTKDGGAILTMGTLAMYLPANKFLNQTEKPMSMHNGYVYRDGQWYERHEPMDGSDYYHETPCSDPYKKDWRDSYGGSLGPEAYD